MKNSVLLFVCIIFGCTLLGCGLAGNEGKADEYAEKVFVVNTVDNQKKLKEYLQYHKNIWPEVEGGFKKAGFKSISLYRFNDLIVMRVTFPKGADLNKMSQLSESFSPRCAEWNKLMNNYQKGVNGTLPGQKWVEVIPFYKFSN
ncbi:hypothetical protein CA265_01250 [Sphingobacteriaceae bacterium GW460-11-11-14-LB5]|nr:hypothetical protein CA265_01250 [Sphingobacteriaceae bacterium GW460-11-11-14-LB5]